MTFWEHFLRLLPHKPKQALAALYWQLTRRKVRARNRLLSASADLPFVYDMWISNVEKNGERTHDFRAAQEGWDWQPRFVIVLHGGSDCTPEELERSFESVRGQTYPSWTFIGGGLRTIGVTTSAKDGDYFIFLRAGDTLSKVALFRLAEALQTEESAAILYGDHDELNSHGRRTHPWFKPRWNSEMFLAQDYLSPAVAVQATLAEALIGKTGDDFDTFLLKSTAAADDQIRHIPHILCHIAPKRNNQTATHRLDAVAKHLQPLGARCRVGSFGTVKVQWPLPPELPAVSLIIPTKDKVELLSACINSVLEQTTYENFEIIIVDNDSVEKRTGNYLEEVSRTAPVRVLKYHGPYNYSAINNFAVRHADGSFVCLLNNDTVVIEPEWLSEMVRYAIRPQVGAVGAKLLYDDGTIQHAGIVIGLGDAAGHAHRFLPAHQPGYHRMPHVAQFVSAVTAACLVIAKEKFLAVGGLDEEHLAVAFNDVDLCLKLERKGWRNVYAPDAVLLHHESKSRGKDSLPQNIDRFMRELNVLRNRWGTQRYEDPLHNPNLDRRSETFVVRL